MVLEKRVQWAIEMAHKTHFVNQDEFMPEEIQSYALAYLEMHRQVVHRYFEIERKRAQELHSKERELQKQDVND